VGEERRQRAGAKVARRLVALFAVVASLTVVGSAAAEYWWFRGNLGAGAVSDVRLSSGAATPTRYVRISWDGHFRYGCTVLTSAGDAWHSRCRYTFDSRSDYEIAFDGSVYGLAGCRNPSPQRAYWANCHQGSRP
jgi:hypothetical protein